jgi:hypothetical protein
MYNYQKKLKSIKKTQFYTSQIKHKFVCFCIYHDLNKHQITDLKNQNLKLQFLKQTVFNKTFKLKGKGPLMAIYCLDFDELVDVVKTFDDINLLNLIHVQHLNKIYPVVKTERIFKKSISTPLPFQLKSNLYNLNILLLGITRFKNTIK